MIESVDVAVIGAGNVGIAVAYYLVTEQRTRNVTLIDALAPMSLTSAQSGENYRNWWPHPIMTAFTDDSTTRLRAQTRAGRCPLPAPRKRRQRYTHGGAVPAAGGA